jgi:hypothetical protein
LFFSFLWQRGKHWHEADPDDLLDWESWRRRGPHPGRISGSKWQRGLAALRLLYEWAALIVRTEDGDVAVAPSATPRRPGLPLPGILHRLRGNLPRPVLGTARTSAPLLLSNRDADRPTDIGTASVANGAPRGP